MDERLPLTPGSPAESSNAPRPTDWHDDPRALQVLTTEHWSLLASRSISWTESFSRATIFLTALSGAVVALALVGQSTDDPRAFVTFALILLPVVLAIGLATLLRLVQVSNLDLLYIQAMNRLRKAYLEVVPGVAPFMSTATHDDIASLHNTFGIRIRPNPIVQLFTTTPAVISLVCAVLVGVIVGIVVGQVGGALGETVASAIAGFVVSAFALQAYSRRAYRSLTDVLEIRFPRDA
jgi:purine-cytosine permease-like protein